MNEQGMPPGQTARRDAIDINDLVYAATGTRVRRLTLPDGSHWFPAADVAGDLGYANTRDAIAKHVPPEHVISFAELARSVPGAAASRKVPGHGLKKSMKMVDLAGLIRLVNACTKPEAEPFKRWVTEVVTAVHKRGGYALHKAEVQPSGTGTPAYVMPPELAEALVRLEQRNLWLDEELAASRRDAQLLRREAVQMQGTIAHMLGRIAESLERIAPHRPFPERLGGAAAGIRPEDLLADWKSRHLVVTGDIWAVATTLAPELAAHGECHHSPETIAARTGLSVQRVRDCLRMMLMRGCIRQLDQPPGGPSGYVLP